MNRFLKRTVIVAFVIGLLLIGYLFFAHHYFYGDFDRKRTRNQLVDNFITHEKEFSALVTTFKSNINIKENVVFGAASNDKINLIIIPLIIDPQNSALGGENLDVNSPAFKIALKKLGWTLATVEKLKKELSQIDCDFIATSDVYKQPVQIYSKPEGWGNYQYYIFSEPLDEELIRIHGKPIEKTGFGSKVVISYSSAL